MKVYDESMIPYTQEYFLQRTPSLQQKFIWIIVSILLATFLFITIAPFEEVVKVKGFIRPDDNISYVVNAVPGRIKSVFYEPGLSVKKGEILLEIDPTQLESEKESLESKMNEENEKLLSLYQIKESIEKKQNLVSKDYYESYLRYELWTINLSKLENIKNLKKEQYQLEKKLPSSMTTKSKIHELESEYLISQSDYETLLYSFPHDIDSEITELETSKKINEAKMKQCEDSLKFTTITSPIDGIVQEIRQFNKNDYIQSGEQILNIIPLDNSSSKVEFSISAKQAGKIANGMKVKMRFPGLPYNEFGGAEGIIISIDPDITKSREGDAFFILRTNLDRSYLSDKKGKQYPLKVGLQTEARIILSKKTILFFILEKLNLWY